MSSEESAGGTPGASGNCFKVVLLGDAGVGKTCLIKALKHDPHTWQFANEYKPTQWAWVTYFDVSDSCRLLIYDSSGRQEFTSLVQLYLRQLHCVIFAFALDDLSSFERLEYWYQLFNHSFVGDVNTVSKFIIGTKMDLAWSSTELQMKAKAFAEEINAEMWVTSAATAFNTCELFTRISECSTCMPYGCFWTLQKQVAMERKSSYLLDDNLMGKGALVRYPDPIPLNTNGVQINDILVTHQCVTMETGEGKTFKWGTWSNRRSQEAVMKVNPQGPFTSYGSGSVNTLWSCVLSKSPPSTWQHENLSGEIVLGTAIRRQPTRTMFKKFKKLLFSSRDMDGWERCNRSFYMLLLSEEDSLFDCGLDSLQTKIMGQQPFDRTVVQNHFQPKPKPFHLPLEGKVSCVSVSKSHAAVVVGSDQTVLTWGRGRDGALGLDEHLVLNFDPPSPLRVTSMNCKVSQVTCGIDFTLFLTSDGQVYSCGSGKMGKLGHGDETDRLLPTLIENLWNIQAIATGSDHALALTIRGALYQWGLECAHEAMASFNATPTRVQQIDNVKVIAVACGTHHSVCVANGIWYCGIPYTWGRGTHGRLGLGHCRGLFVPRYMPEFYDKVINVVQVSAGRKHTGFLTKDGDVYTCGSNEFGQLGFFTASGFSATPIKVDLTNNAIEAKDRVTGICCHEDYTMISTEQGNVVVWGKCFYGPNIGASMSINPNGAGAPHIIAVTTCHLPCKHPEESIVELVLGLTSSNSLVLCGGITCEFDCQVMVDCKPLIPCDKVGLTALSSVGPVLVAVDRHGKCVYTNIDEWVTQLIGNICKDRVHLLCSILKETESNKVPPIQFKPISSLPGNVNSVESSLRSFLFCTDMGDVYSWFPFSGEKLMHHNELNGEIIVQVACGASHFVALTDDGTLFACGRGSAGQLGHGTFESVEKFQAVSLTKFERVRNVCCGWASTVALTLDGKVFFWGQLDVPKGEKRHSRLASISAKQRISEVAPALQETHALQDGPPATAFKVQFTGDALLTDKHFAVVGRPFEFEIVPRDEVVINSSYAEFRVDTVSLQDSHDAHSKGKIKRCRTSQGAYSVSTGFHSVGVFKVCVTRNGNHILGSPFRVNVENGATVSRCKVSLIGCDMECLRAVAGLLQQFIISRDLAVEFWGIPSTTTDLQTHEACMLSSVTDGGIFIYVWDACYGNLSEENLNVWLHLLKLRAPSAEVLILGINCSATCANEIDMRSFQKVNPQLTQAIFTGTSFSSDPKGLLEEVQILANQVTRRQELVWHKFEILASKIVNKKKSGLEILDERNMKSLAAECGIHGGFLLKQAVNFLQLVGLGLLIGTDDHFFIIQQQWLARHLTGIAKSSHHGTLDSSDLDKPKQHLVEFLTRKGMAVRGPEDNKIDIIHFLSPIAAENWPLVTASDYTAYRHLILCRPPFYLHFIFQRLVADLLQLYDIVSLGKYSLVIQTEQCNYRLDLGPCLVNKTVAEIRVTVRASTQDLCAVGVEHIVDQLRGLLNEIMDPSEVAVKVSCSICRRQYHDVPAVHKVAAQENTRLKCAKCGDNKVSPGNLLRGFNETRPFPEMIWNPFPEPSKQGTPPSLQALVTPLMRYFGEREEWQSRRLLQEIRGMMRNLAKVFADTKYYTTPRTVCLLPEFQRSSVLKRNAIKMMLTWSQPKYRLFLLCEGNGDGTGVHFLDKNKHEGYLLESSAANGLISNSVDLLRVGLQLLMTISPLLSLSRSLGCFMIEHSKQWETLNNVLGLVGLSGAMLCKVPWKSHFKEMDAFLKGFQETAKSIHQPKNLSELSTPGVGYQVSGETYQYLRKLLSELGTTDDFGGLKQEVREGIGAIWVCDKHNTTSCPTKAIKVMP